MRLSFLYFHYFRHLRELHRLFVLLHSETLPLHNSQIHKFPTWQVPIYLLLEVRIPELIQLIDLVLSQSFNALKRVWFVLLHVVVPCTCELAELLSLDLLNVLEFLVLRFFHLSHLAQVLYLWNLVHAFLASLGFKIVQLGVALV